MEVNQPAGATALARLTKELTLLCSLSQHAIFALKGLSGTLWNSNIVDHNFLIVHPKLGLALCPRADGVVVDGGHQVLYSS